MVEASPAWNPHATLAELTTSSNRVVVAQSPDAEPLAQVRVQIQFRAHSLPPGITSAPEQYQQQCHRREQIVQLVGDDAGAQGVR